MTCITDVHGDLRGHRSHIMEHEDLHHWHAQVLHAESSGWLFTSPFEWGGAYCSDRITGRTACYASAPLVRRHYAMLLSDVCLSDV